MKIKEMRALKSEELSERLETAHEELFDLRLRLSIKKLVNHREIPRAKREIARIKTLIRERELGIR